MSQDRGELIPELVYEQQTVLPDEAVQSVKVPDPEQEVLQLVKEVQVPVKAEVEAVDLL